MVNRKRKTKNLWGRERQSYRWRKKDNRNLVKLIYLL